MVSSVIEATAPLKKPVAADKAVAASEKLQMPLKATVLKPERLHRRWGTVIFMAAIHALTLYALLPKFWSFQAFGAFFNSLLDNSLPRSNTWIPQIIIP